jgi:hypothetical protein
MIIPEPQIRKTNDQQQLPPTFYQYAPQFIPAPPKQFQFNPAEYTDINSQIGINTNPGMISLPCRGVSDARGNGPVRGNGSFFDRQLVNASHAGFDKSVHFDKSVYGNYIR